MITKKKWCVFETRLDHTRCIKCFQKKSDAVGSADWHRKHYFNRRYSVRKSRRRFERPKYRR